MNEKRKEIQQKRLSLKNKILTKVSRDTKNIVVPEYTPNVINGVEYYTRPQKGHVHPFYSTNADYNTDSASYYDYLAKFNDLLQALIDQVNENSKNIDLIFDMLDDLQAQIDVINVRLDLIEEDIDNIYKILIEINNKLDDLQNQIDEINNKLDDLQNQIDDILDMFDNYYTKSEVSRYFTKSVTQYTVPTDFDINDYRGKSFAQMFYDYLTLCISEFYPSSTPSSVLVRIFLIDENTIATKACLDLLNEYYGIVEDDVSSDEFPMSFMIVAEFSTSNINIPSKLEIIANDFTDIFVFIIDIKAGSNPDLDNLSNSDIFKKPKIWDNTTI